MVMPVGTPFLKEKINNQSMIKMPNIPGGAKKRPEHSQVLYAVLLTDF